MSALLARFGGWLLSILGPIFLDFIVSKYRSWKATREKEAKAIENEEILKEIENAETDAERQAALDRLARRTRN